MNELEWVAGEEEDYIYANIWYRDVIVKIGLSSQRVVREWDMSALRADNMRYLTDRMPDVLNGIAFDKSTGYFILTGKYWNRYYVVNLDGQPMQ